MAGNLLSGYDATDGLDGAVYGDCYGNYAHGTCCAGIIAAIDNSIGTKGVASNCMIIPIRIMKTNSFSDDDDAVEGMNYAWETANADVISCSWKKSGSPIPELDDEISYALELGRDGLGCVVVFATGNDNGSVCYPANSNPDIIAVGAMSPCGERKNPNSCDGENWGSNYGSTLDVVAPGVLISTTDIQSSAGYNSNIAIHTLNGGDKVTTDYSNQSYTVWFNGTSAATPHVAGVAALILTVNPDLTQDEVRDIIESTCTKVGSYNYSTVAGRNNGTWNNQTGYGCVNAYAAVRASLPSISGPELLCSTGATYSVPDAPSGTYVYWSYSSNIQSYYGGNNWVALRSIGNGAGWVEATITNTNCGNITLPRMTVWAGIPTAYNFYTEVNGEEVEYYETALICPDITSCLDAWPEVEEMSTTNYTWHLPSWYSGNGSFGSNGICFNPNGTIGSSITADVTNSCGTGYGVLQIYFGNNGCRSSYQYAISPNPASTELTVEQLTAEEAVGRSVLEPAEVYDLSDTKDADDGSYTVEIWHEKKGKVTAVTSKSKKEVIDVSKLEKGYYILHIRTKQALYQEHILVK